MANDPKRLIERFIAFSGAGKSQLAIGTPLATVDIDTRDKCVITSEEVVLRRDDRDCRGEDLIAQPIRTRGLRFTLNYAELTPQIVARWLAYYLGASAAPTGTPADEVQTVTVAGSGTLAMTLEGRVVTTATIPATVTAAQLQALLVAARMAFIQPGDAVVTGTGPFTVTFPNTGRLGRANLPTMVGSGGVSVAASANGAQKFHAVTRSTSTVKQRLGFILGWENVTDRFEKYSDFVCESITLTLTRRQNVTMNVVLMGPWEPEILVDADYDAPACINPVPLLTDDCRVLVNSNWETADVNTATITLNDNVPTDETSAYDFDTVDIQVLERGDNPTYGIAASIFGRETDNIYVLAQNERTQAPVDVKVHMGTPGNRASVLAPYAKVKFQGNRLSNAGALRKSVINLEITPFRQTTNVPVKAEAYVSQTTAFLAT